MNTKYIRMKVYAYTSERDKNTLNHIISRVLKLFFLYKLDEKYIISLGWSVEGSEASKSRRSE